MIISVASGKGGTGKTTVATNLAVSLNHKVQLLDCDVEEPNAHLFLNPDKTNQIEKIAPENKIEVSGKIIFEYSKNPQDGIEVEQVWKNIYFSPDFNTPVVQILQHL